VAVLEIVYSQKITAMEQASTNLEAERTRAERAEAEAGRLYTALAKYGTHQMEANDNGALTWLCPAMRHEPDDFYGDPGPCDPVRCWS